MQIKRWIFSTSSSGNKSAIKLFFSTNTDSKTVLHQICELFIPYICLLTWLSCLMMFCAAKVLFFRFLARFSMSSASFSCRLWWCCRTASSSAADWRSSRGKHLCRGDTGWSFYTQKQVQHTRSFRKARLYLRFLKSPSNVRREKKNKITSS